MKNRPLKKLRDKTPPAQKPSRANAKITGTKIARARKENLPKNPPTINHRTNHGLVDWLLACPARGFFTPIPSESTDTL